MEPTIPFNVNGPRLLCQHAALDGGNALAYGACVA